MDKSSFSAKDVILNKNDPVPGFDPKASYTPDQIDALIQDSLETLVKEGLATAERSDGLIVSVQLTDKGWAFVEESKKNVGEQDHGSF